jgi:hypothetical protein
MITSAHARRLTSLNLKSELEYWLFGLSVTQLKYIMVYLNKKTTVRYGPDTSKANIIRNILAAVFHICRINSNTGSITPMPNNLVPPLSANRSPTSVTATTDTTTPNTGVSPTPQRLNVSLDTRDNTDNNFGEWIETRPAPRVMTSHEAGFRMEVNNNVFTPLTVQNSYPPIIRSNETFNSPRHRMNIPTPAYRSNIRSFTPQQNTTTYQVFKFDEPCDESDECPICYENINNETFVKLNCSHKYCKKCIKGCLNSNFFKCSMCREPITHIYTHNPVVVSYSL